MSQDDSQDVRDVQIHLPDIEETQVWQEENETREVSLFLKTKDGRTDGPQYPGFILPNRWTFETLQSCVIDYVKRQGFSNTVAQLYYKRGGKSRALLPLNGDGDITNMLREYPLEFPSGRRKAKVAKMVMAVDLHPAELYKAKGTPPRTPQGQCELFTSPRRSPRLMEKHATPKPYKKDVIDVFLFGVNTDSKGVLQLSKTSAVLQSCGSSLDKLKDDLRAYQDSTVIYVPVNGLYWLRKGSKQLVRLQTNKDFQCCKAEYKDSKGHLQSIRLACATLPLQSKTPDASKAAKQSKKRTLDFTGVDLDVVGSESNQGKKPANVNDLWNDIHCDLVRDLEKKGIMPRYSVRHLKLWTDMIVDGRSVGIGDEPKWENFIDVIGVPPKSARDKPEKKENNLETACSSTDNLLKAMILQNQQKMEVESKRSEMFQNSLLAILANSPFMHQQSKQQSSPGMSNFYPVMCSTPLSPSSVQDSSSGECMSCSISNCSLPSSEPGKSNIAVYTTEQVCRFMEEHNLSQFIPKFVEAEVDGPLLISLCHPHLGESILSGMGIDGNDGKHIIQAVKKKLT